MVEVYIDGSSIGNPGKMGAGYLIYKNLSASEADKVLIRKEGVYLGIGTNNFCEYMALVIALVEVLDLGEKKCQVYSDSKLLCEQLKGNFKVKNSSLYTLFVLARRLMSKFEVFNIDYIRREKNQAADKLAKGAAGFLA